MPCYNTATYKRLQWLLSCPPSFIPPTPQNSAQSFAVAFPAIMPAQQPAIQDRHKRLYITCATLERITTTGRPPAHTRYQIHAGRCTGQHKPPYYNNVYKGAAYNRPCQPGGVCSYRLRIAGKCGHAVSGADAAHLLRGQRLHLHRVNPAAVSIPSAPGGLRSSTGPARRGSPAACGAESLAATAVSLFGLSPDS